jgi:long-chain acyl-CoA synthetase
MKLFNDTVPGLFLNVTKEHGSAVAMRKKGFGIWQEITWHNYRLHVEELFHGLRHLGMQRGDVVCILSANRPEWLYADLACQCAGALPLGIHSGSLEPEVEFIVNHNQARFIVLENQGQADKILGILDKIPSLEKFIVIKWDGMELYDHPKLVSYEDVKSVGRRMAREFPLELEESVAAIKPTDVAFLSLTSGTTTNPKSVMLSHRCVIALADSLLAVEAYDQNDEEISYPPLPWITERFFSVILHMKARYKVNFPETMEMNIVLENMRELWPTILAAPPRIWESLFTSVCVRRENTSWFKRKILGVFMPVAEEVAKGRQAKKRISPVLNILYLIGDLAVYRKIRDHLGLRHLRSAYTTGSALCPEVYTFFHAIGVNLRQIYGQTEAGGFCCIQGPCEADPETVGRPLPAVKITISDSHEILVRSPDFLGYYNDPSLTNESLRGCWQATGDEGYLRDDGHLVVVDRQKDLIRTVLGHKLSPQSLENWLKFSPYIKEAIVVGQGRPFVAVMVQIDLDYVGNWAQRGGIPYTTYRDLVSKPQVVELIRKVVEEVNQMLDEPCRIKRYKLLEKELDPDDGEMTRTAKLRRDSANRKFKGLIESLYSE